MNPLLRPQKNFHEWWELRHQGLLPFSDSYFISFQLAQVSLKQPNPLVFESHNMAALPMFSWRQYNTMVNKGVVIFFLLGDSPTSEFYMLTFRNTLFHLHRQCKQEGCLNHLFTWNRVFETSAHKIQTPENHPKERTQNTEHGESFKSRKSNSSLFLTKP